MLRIEFKYKDRFSHGQWRTQSCTVTSLEKCIELYGLEDPDVEYEIISVKEA